MTKFRTVCRWLHRELGYVAVGLTLVYGISGIAVNHVHHWDANYQHSVVHTRMEPVGLGPTGVIAPLVLERLQLTEPVKNTWRASRDKLQIFVSNATIEVDLVTGEVIRQSFKKRPFLYDFNFMHLNTGKAPWTGIADTYAGVLVILALTGIFLVKGRRGLAGRGGLMMGLGILLPLVYVFWERYL